MRAFLVSIVLTFGISSVPGGVHAATPSLSATPTTVAPDDDTTRPTINEFMPEDQALSDCLSSLPKPGCGSKARGGWRQTLVFIAIIVALAFIVWRIIHQSRKARGLPSLLSTVTNRRTPAATSAPVDDDGAPAP